MCSGVRTAKKHFSQDKSVPLFRSQECLVPLLALLDELLAVTVSRKVESDGFEITRQTS